MFILRKAHFDMSNLRVKGPCRISSGGAIPQYGNRTVFPLIALCWRLGEKVVCPTIKV